MIYNNTIVRKVESPNLDKQKKSGNKKLKKDALEYINYVEEYKKDSKFKTELCKSFTDTEFCAYGNKCRFAHGKKEMFEKQIDHPKYRKNDCVTFHTNGFCNYGQRCHFRHNELRQLNEITRSYYSFLIQILPLDNINNRNRLDIFKNISKTFDKNPQMRNEMILPYNQIYDKGFINKLKRMININDYFQFTLNAKSNINYQKVYSNSNQKADYGRKSSESSSYSRNSISLNSNSTDDSFLHSKYNYKNINNFVNKNLSKQINFSNIDEQQHNFFQ
jgi:hypothetical protein